MSNKELQFKTGSKVYARFFMSSGNYYVDSATISHFSESEHFALMTDGRQTPASACFETEDEALASAKEATQYRQNWLSSISSKDYLAKKNLRSHYGASPKEKLQITAKPTPSTTEKPSATKILAKWVKDFFPEYF